MVGTLETGASGLGLSTGQRPCVVFLGKILNFHGAFLHPGV